MLTLLATGMLQRVGDVLVVGTVLVLATFGYQCGLFLAVLAGLHALASLVVALTFADPLASLLASFEVPAAYAFPAAFGVLLGGTAGAIRLAVGGYVPADVVRLAPLIDKLAGGMIGAVAGMVAAGAGLIALSVIPLPDPLGLDGAKLNYDMGTRMLRTFARCVESNEAKQKVLLEGEPGTVAAPERPPEPPPAPEHHEEPAHETDAAHDAGDAAKDGQHDEAAHHHKRRKHDRHKTESEKPAAPPPPPPPPAWSEPFADLNGNKTHDDGEPYLDTDKNNAFTARLVFEDQNGNGRRDIGLLERYRLHAWGRQVISVQAVDDVPPPDPAAAGSDAAAPAAPPAETKK